MGQASSSSKISRLSQKDLNLDDSTFNKIQKSCSATSSGQNTLEISGSYVTGSDINQQNIIDNLCILRTAIDQRRKGAITSNVEEAVNQDLEAEGGLPGTGGSSDSIQQLITKMNTKVNRSVTSDIIANCILSQNVGNSLKITSSVVRNSNIGQVNHAFARCLMNNDIVNTIDSSFKDKYVAESNSTGSSGALLGGNTLEMAMAASVVLCCSTLSVSLLIFIA